MAERIWDQAPVTLGRQRVVINGSFAPNGSSALDATKVLGKGFSVAYTSTGLFTVTLKDTYAKLISWNLSPGFAAGDDKILQLGVVTSSHTSAVKTIQIRVWDISGAAVADVAANANNRISFEFTLSNSPTEY